MAGRPRLILIYDAEGGVLAQLGDAVRKLVGPQGDACALHALTFGALAMHGAWQRTLDSLPVDPVFLHRGQAKVAALAPGIALPAILLRQGSTPPEVIVAATDVERCAALDALIALLLDRLAPRGIVPQAE